MKFLLSIFTEHLFIPHGHCYLWKPGLVGLHITSDLLIALAYYSIPLALVYFVRRRADLPYSGLFLLFGAFIVSCGTTHIMEIWTLWHPTYWLSGFLKAFTAFLSVYTAILMVPVIPQALALPSPTQLKVANQKLEVEIIERKRIEEKLRESNRTFRAIFNNTFQFTGLLTPEGILLEANQASLDFGGLQLEDIINRPFWEAQWWTMANQTQENLKNAIAQVAQNGKFIRYEVDVQGAGNGIATIDFSLKPIKDEKGCVVLLVSEGRDITQRKQAEAAVVQLNAQLEERVKQRTAQLETANQLLFGQTQVLEMIATGASLSDVLDVLALTTEAQSQEMLCSVLLLDADGQNLKQGAAPSLPTSYQACVDGIAIASNVGSGGTIADVGQPVIVPDIALDPPGGKFRDVALSHGLRACWFHPILSSQGKILGTFAIYYREPRRPSLKDLQLIETAAHIAGIAIEHKQVEQVLRESEERFRGTFEQAAVGIAHVSPEGRYVRLNQKYCDLVGYNHEEMLTLTFQEITYSDDLLEDMKYVRQLLDAEIETFSMDKRYIRKDTSLVWVTLTVSLVRKPSGEPKYFIVVIQDITSLKQTQKAVRQANEQLERRVLSRTAELEKANAALAESEERLRLFIENVPSAIAMFDHEMHYLATSQRWLTDYNLGEQNIIGRCHYEIFPDLPDHWKEDYQNVLAGNVIKSEEDLFLRSDGSTHWLRSELHPWHNSEGKVAGMIMFTEMITERKEAQQKLQAANAELARSNQELEHFAYVASHDLREPLRKIRSYTDLLAKRYQGQLDEKADKYIAYITDGTVRMQALITDLLTYSRVGKGKISLEPTNLEVILNRTLNDLSTTIQENNAVIRASLLPMVRANSSQMGQLLQNLIANAIKFRSKEPPQIQIQAVQQHKFWMISVQDNGIGIESQYVERIFVIFQRLHTREEYPGTGIGLAVCKKIVEHHGGQIWVESEPGQGTTFFFTLPAV